MPPEGQVKPLSVHSPWRSTRTEEYCVRRGGAWRETTLADLSASIRVPLAASNNLCQLHVCRGLLVAIDNRILYIARSRPTRYVMPRCSNHTVQFHAP